MCSVSVWMMLVRCGVIWCAAIDGGFYAGPILKCVYVGNDTKDVHNNDRYHITSDPRTSTHQIPNQTYDIVCEGIAQRLVRILEVP